MLRLPPTSLAVSQNDVQTTLQHLDFFTGLLKQGFKKHEIVRYLRENDIDQAELGSVAASAHHVPSTYDLILQSDSSAPSSRQHSIERETVKDVQSQQQYASPASSSPQDTLRVEGEPVQRGSDMDFVPSYGTRHYAPRQSSLLRFARGISSESSGDEGCEIPPFTHRQSVTYRPRSETYSYDQSEAEGSDDATSCVTPVDELEQLSLDGDLLDSVESKRTAVRTISNLRPSAQPFTPMHVRTSRSACSLSTNGSAAASRSGIKSVPSSPPLLARSSNDTLRDALPMTPVPRASLQARGNMNHMTSQGLARQQFLDGSFTIYNDSVAARLQPQTPADLNQGRYLDEFSAAYTAPPGMIRSSATRHGVSNTRQASGELSPVARAAMIRERRQREFARGLRVEGLRIDRAHTDRRQLDARPTVGLNQLELWRDDLDADGIGEENFEEASITALLRGMRVVSGNRRAG